MNYTAQGGFNLKNCGEYSFTYNVLNLYSQGDLIAIKAKALDGKLEKILIKKINIVNINEWNYQDKENRIWLEYELCNLDEAAILIKNYVDQEILNYNFLIDHC